MSWMHCIIPLGGQDVWYFNKKNKLQDEKVHFSLHINDPTLSHNVLHV